MRAAKEAWYMMPPARLWGQEVVKVIAGQVSRFGEYELVKKRLIRFHSFN